MRGTAVGAPLVLAIALGLLAASAARAQAPARLTGRVLDAETGEGVAGAIVKSKNGSAQATTDAQGKYELTGLPAGQIEVIVQALGYDRRTWKAEIAAGQEMSHNFSLDFTGEKLPEIMVTARAEKLMPRYAEFERRRARGGGAYLRWDDILKKNFASIGEAAQSIRGVKWVCDDRSFECDVRMSRTTCPPIWWVDGVQVGSFHENTPIRDVYGLEFYRGASEVPAEFTGSQAACGVVVVWTKSKPYQ